MPDRETSVANFHESLLTAEMGPTDLTAVVDATSPLTSPTLVVIEPDEPTQREVILFDGSFTATQFATTDIANRYLEGSAAGSGLTHPIGAIVRSAPLAHHIIDLNDRIDADAAVVTAHAADADDHHAEDHATRHLEDGADPLGWPGNFEVDDHLYEAGPIVMTTASISEILSFNLTIPADWNSWDAVVEVSYSPERTSGTTASYQLFARIDGIGGTQEKFASINSDVTIVDGFMKVRATGRSATGAVAVEFRGRATSGDVSMTDIFLYARAVRTG